MAKTAAWWVVSEKFNKVQKAMSAARFDRTTYRYSMHYVQCFSLSLYQLSYADDTENAKFVYELISHYVEVGASNVIL